MPEPISIQDKQDKDRRLKGYRFKQRLEQLKFQASERIRKSHTEVSSQAPPKATPAATNSEN